MRCPYCGSAVEPMRDAHGALVCPACQNTGVARGAPPTSPGLAATPFAPLSPPPMAPPGPSPGPAGPTSSKAVAALVLGICAFILWPLAIVLGILAMVFGFLALRETKADPRIKGRGMGVAGVVMGSIALLIGLIVVAALAFVLVSEVGQGGSDTDIWFSEDTAGPGGTLTVEDYDGFASWSDFEVSGTADCQLPFGDVEVGDEVECFSDGSVRIRYVPTGETVHASTV